MQPKPVLGVHHIAVVVADLPAAEHFYVGILGLTVERRWSFEDGSARSVWLRLPGGTRLMLERMRRRAPRGVESAGWHLLALGIDESDRQAWRQHLKGAGVEVFEETPHTLYVRDPEGNRVGLSSYPPPP